MGAVIRSFRHKGVQRFFETGSKSGIQASPAGVPPAPVAPSLEAGHPGIAGAADLTG